MGLVVAALVVVAAGCYSPELRDCAVTCTGAADCADGQGCTASGFCAAAGTTCAPEDAAVDARLTDALRVTVVGRGSVVVDGAGTCTNLSTMGMGTTCMYAVPMTGPVTAHAQVTDGNHDFDKWTDSICKNQPQTCTFSPLPITVIQAQFQ